MAKTATSVAWLGSYPVVNIKKRDVENPKVFPVRKIIYIHGAFCWACLKTVDLIQFMAGHLRPCQFMFVHGENSCEAWPFDAICGLPNFETTPSHYPMNYSILAAGEFLTSENHPWIDRKSKNPLAIFEQFALENGTSK